MNHPCLNCPDAERAAAALAKSEDLESRRKKAFDTWEETSRQLGACSLKDRLTGRRRMLHKKYEEEKTACYVIVAEAAASYDPAIHINKCGGPFDHTEDPNGNLVEPAEIICGANVGQYIIRQLDQAGE